MKQAKDDVLNLIQGLAKDDKQMSLLAERIESASMLGPNFRWPRLKHVQKEKTSSKRQTGKLKHVQNDVFSSSSGIP